MSSKIARLVPLALLLPLVARGGTAAWEFSSFPADAYEECIEDIGPPHDRVAAIRSIKGASPVMAHVGQAISAKTYRGTRVRAIARLRTQGVVGYGATLWIRVEAPDRVNPDDLSSGLLRGDVDWTEQAREIDVPANATYIAFGAALGGEGQLWADDFELLVVGTASGLEGRNLPEAPVNADFASDEVNAAWLAEADDECQRGIEDIGAPHGNVAMLRCARPPLTPASFVGQHVAATRYRGSRIRVSADVKTQGVGEPGATAWVRVDGPRRTRCGWRSARLTGDSDWLRQSLEIDVPSDATYIGFGIDLDASGSIWVDDERLEVIGPLHEPLPGPLPPRPANLDLDHPRAIVLGITAACAGP